MIIFFIAKVRCITLFGKGGHAGETVVIIKQRTFSNYKLGVRRSKEALLFVLMFIFIERGHSRSSERVLSSENAEEEREA